MRGRGVGRPFTYRCRFLSGKYRMAFTYRCFQARSSRAWLQSGCSTFRSPCTDQYHHRCSGGPHGDREPMACEIHQRGARVFPSALLNNGRSTKGFAAMILVNRSHRECHLIVSYGDGSVRGTYFLRRVTDRNVQFLKGQEAKDAGHVPGELLLRRTRKSSIGKLRCCHRCARRY